MVSLDERQRKISFSIKRGSMSTIHIAPWLHKHNLKYVVGGVNGDAVGIADVWPSVIMSQNMESVMNDIVW